METISKKIRLLLVEDSPVQTELIRSQLSQQFEIESIDCLAKMRPFLFDGKTDIILLDLHLPDSQGLQTYIDCRSQAPDTPIVILTVSSDDALALEAIRRGAQDFLVKDNVDEKIVLRALRYSLERHESQKKILELSFVDELTKLKNRRGFQILAEGQIRLAIRNSQNCVLVYLDIDDFKAINDRFGHSMGDEALKSMGRILYASFRDSDVIARIGGDEFAVFALGANEGDKAIVSNRIEHNLKEYNKRLSDKFPALAVSWGMAIFGYKHPRPVEALIKEADEKMYKHKSSKKQ